MRLHTKPYSAAAAAAAAAAEVECGICLEVVVSKPRFSDRRFGLLSVRARRSKIDICCFHDRN